ncbi:MAG: YIP1 family protein [bacterium]
MLNIFFAPIRRFQVLSTKPDWTRPLILALIVPLLIGTLSVILLPRQTLITSTEGRINRAKEFIDQQIEKGRMPSDQRDAALERIEQTSRSELEFYHQASKISLFLRFLVHSLPAIVWSALQLLIWTTILNLLLPLMGATASFGRMFVITTNSALVRIPAALFRALLMLITGKLTAGTSLVPLGSGAPLYLKGVLACIDIFTIWELLLVSFGMKVIFNLNSKRTTATVFSLWLVYVFILAGVLMLSGGLALSE